MFAGRHFSSGDASLDPYVQLLDARVAALFPEFSDGSAAARLRLRPEQASGRGLSLADGYLPPPGTPLALYFGEVVLDWEPGDYVLALPSFRRLGITLRPSVDAAGPCDKRRPALHNAALCNHTCHGATVVLRRPAALRDCPLSCVVAYPAAGLQAGGRLLWDYDGGSRSGNGGFTVDLTRSLELHAEGVRCAPCACRRPQLCPRGRWFRIPDA